MNFEKLITPRFDPNATFDYVCKEERNDLFHTTFHLRGLNVLEFRKCEELSTGEKPCIGNFHLEVIKTGLIGWDKFYWGDSLELIPFNFDNISAIPYKIQLELVEEILNFSSVDKKLEEDLIFVVKWSDYLQKTKNAVQWDCEYCIQNNQDGVRNCDGTKPNRCITCQIETMEDECPECGKKTVPHFKMRIGGQSSVIKLTRCPIATLSPVAVKLANLINFMENSKSLPFSGGALEQTNFFYNVRMIVMSEQNALLKSEMENKK